MRFPSQQLETAKILSGFPPGGTSDAMSRRIADKLRMSSPVGDSLPYLKSGRRQIGFTAES